MMHRRNFLGAGLGLAAYTAGSFVPAWAQNAPNLGTPTLPTPGFRRTKIGDVEVIALNDGIARRPLGEEFVKNAPLAEVRALLASQGLATDYIDVPFTPFLVIAGARKMLIDTGLGEFGGPTTGKLLENLRAAGVQASDIDTVLISHFHGDHINGIRNKAGELVFSKAKVMVPAVEYAFWMDDARMAAAPAGMKGAFENVRRTFGGMGTDTLVQFAAGAEVGPGIQSVAAYGHTPGHSLFELTSAGQKFFYVADLTNVPALFARNPDWAVTFDMDAEAARKVRRDVFQRVTASKAMVGGFHFPFPAFGRMAAAGNGYAFEPLA
ncbi:MAG: MBL fold metallo-hydrolase [Acidovorax sp.]|jgi:glyoxylase-like metal-dependent hydrolase (beta-lactamase superfamily II)|uniref:MBL fold metallo-hydrolase n=1 Tax=Acidovorax sp. TaxID=1872122 RepID=UPI000AA984F8|nr:MBL fold metallo-hydrolase [Acidovorax sp.]MDH4427009.1 MBL fold metallo-hydrolase [Acidovorax sp.]MDH4447595.1 MBL fold metallo-hydrolase [Acidovorax sp.]MDH4462513.1 MBL fold metallo-hydrolase [Acidovorax sp.]